MNEYLREAGKPEIIIIGRGTYGLLPLTPEAKRILDNLSNSGVRIIIDKTNDALIKLIEEYKDKKILAVIHVTC